MFFGLEQEDGSFDYPHGTGTSSTSLAYSTGEFQALQLIVLATFGAVD